MQTKDSGRDSSDIERVKQIVAEIIKCSDGQVIGKVRLYKIFYFAHLMYAKESPGYLSEWPLVRMPYGPGIEGADTILDEMVRDGLIEIRPQSIGPYTASEFRVATDSPPSLPLDAIDAIRRAVAFTKDKTAAELSELTHEFSNSWKYSRDGDTLNIYADLLTEEAYLDMRRRVQQDAADLRAIAG